MREDIPEYLGIILAGLGIFTIASMFIYVLFLIHWIVEVFGIGITMIICGLYIIDN